MTSHLTKITFGEMRSSGVGGMTFSKKNGPDPETGAKAG